MDLPELVIVGAGGHAMEVAAVVEDLNAERLRWQLHGLLADAGTQAHFPASRPVIGDLDWVRRHPDTQVVVAVGAPRARWGIVTRLREAVPGVRFATLIHPRAWIAQGASIGDGSVLFAGALVNVNVRIGAHASVNLGCTISHDCVLGDFVSLGPGVHLAGGVQVGSGADLGVGCSVKPMTRIGNHAVVGAGAAVIDDIPSDATVAGVPARPLPGRDD